MSFLFCETMSPENPVSFYPAYFCFQIVQLNKAAQKQNVVWSCLMNIQNM